MNKIIIFLIFLTIFSSCQFSKKSVCTNIKDPCFICDIANSQNININDFALFIETINIVAISKNKYKAQDAIDELNKIKNILNINNISYIVFKNIIYDLISKNPALYIISKKYGFYIDAFDSQEIIDSKSKEILINWIDSIIKDMETYSSF